ncbi:MAG: hypothetical protein ABI955_07545, partial [Nitrospirota bacterium]
MIGAIYLSAKQNEWHGLLPLLAALLGIFILDLPAALGTAVLMGFVLPPWFVHRLAIKPDISLPLLTLMSLLRTHVIAAGYFLSPPGMGTFILTVNRAMGAVPSAHTMSTTYYSYHLLKQGKSHERNNDPP